MSGVEEVKTTCYFKPITINAYLCEVTLLNSVHIKTKAHLLPCNCSAVFNLWFNNVFYYGVSLFAAQRTTHR